MVKLEKKPDDLAAAARLLRKVEFFSALTVAQIDKVLPFILFYGYKRGEKIFGQGEIGDAFYIIHEGQVEVRIRRSLFWFSKRVAVLNPGDFVGEMALLERAPRSASVLALCPAKLFALTRNDFDYFLNENPAFGVEVKRIAERRKFEDSRRR